MPVEKKTLKIISILIMLAIIYALMNFINKSSEKNLEKFSKLIDKNSINTIEIIKKDGEKIRLEKRDNLWKMTQPIEIKVKENLVNNLISNISQAYLTGPLCEDEKLYPRFEIYPQTSTIITLKNPSKKISMLIGKINQDFNGSFVKFEDSRGIYELSGIMPYEIIISSYEIMDRRLIETEKEKAIKISIDYENKKIELTKSGQTWIGEKNIKADSIIDSIYNINFERITNQNKYKRNLSIKVLDELKKEENIECSQGKDGFYCDKNNFSVFITKESLNPLINQIKK